MWPAIPLSFSSWGQDVLSWFLLLTGLILLVCYPRQLTFLSSVLWMLPPHLHVGWCSLSGICGQSCTVGSHQCHNCKGLSSTMYIWATLWQNQQCGCAPSEESDQPGHLCPVWKESSLTAWRKLGSLANHWADIKDSDKTGRIPMLIWVFAGRTVILLVLSWGSPFVNDFMLFFETLSWLMVIELACFFVASPWLNGPRQANLVLIAYASIEGSGEPAHPRSLARTFAARSEKQWVKRNLQTESQIHSPSEWLGMRSWNLSWRNARRHKFAWRGSNGMVSCSYLFFSEAYFHFLTLILYQGLLPSSFLYWCLAHLGRRLTRWAYNIAMVRRPSVVHTFKLEYLWGQITSSVQILFVA